MDKVGGSRLVSLRLRLRRDRAETKRRLADQQYPGNKEETKAIAFEPSVA